MGVSRGVIEHRLPLISRRGHASIEHPESRPLLSEMNNDITSHIGAESIQCVLRLWGRRNVSPPDHQAPSTNLPRPCLSRTRVGREKHRGRLRGEGRDYGDAAGLAVGLDVGGRGHSRRQARCPQPRCRRGRDGHPALSVDAGNEEDSGQEEEGRAPERALKLRCVRPWARLATFAALGGRARRPPRRHCWLVREAA